MQNGRKFLLENVRNIPRMTNKRSPDQCYADSGSVYLSVSVLIYQLVCANATNKMNNI
jgi:hypothetical protein